MSGVLFLKKTIATTFNLVAICLCVSSTVGLAPAQDTKSPSGPDRGSPAELSKQIVELRALVEKLQARVDELEKRSPAQETDSRAAATASTAQAAPSFSNTGTAPEQTQPQSAPSQVASAPNPAGFLRGSTVNLLFDGYYAFNFNNPIGRASTFCVPMT